MKKNNPMNVLIVDDMKPLLILMENGLKKFGYNVFVADSGEKAVETFRDNYTAVVICDYGMDGMNGFDVGKAIKTIAQEKGAAKPYFIMLTGWGSELRDQSQLDQAGIDRVMEKPVEIPLLLSLLAQIFAEIG